MFSTALWKTAINMSSCINNIKHKNVTEFKDRSAHHHFIVFEGSFVVQAKLGDHHPGALPQVVLPHAHVLLSPDKQQTNSS